MAGTERKHATVLFYYVFHVLSLGHTTRILGRLWLAYDITYPTDEEKDVLGLDSKRSASGWKSFDDCVREFCRGTGVLAALVAATAAALLALDPFNTSSATRALFLFSLTCSIISASTSINYLSNVHPDPALIELRWRRLGMIFVLSLAAPFAWLSMGFWTFQAALLAGVWEGNSVPEKVVVTAAIGFRLGMMTYLRASALGWEEMVKDSLFGLGMGMDHRMVVPRRESIEIRKRYHAEIKQRVRKLQAVMDLDVNRVLAEYEFAMGQKLEGLPPLPSAATAKPSAQQKHSNGKSSDEPVKPEHLNPS